MDRVPGATDSAIIGTVGRLVGLDTSFSQPISAFQLVHTRVPNMYELNRAVKILPASVTQDNLFRPTYDRDVLTHPNEECNPCRHLDAPVMTRLPFFVVEYLEWYPTCLQAARFRGMQTDRNDFQF